jgi:hypothetical protein
MLEQDDFFKWAESFYHIGIIFEGRHDVYPICRKWVDEWYKKGYFTIEQDDLKSIFINLDKHNYDMFRGNIKNDKEWDLLKKTANEKIGYIVTKHLSEGQCDNIGFGISTYLFTWNFRRYKEYLFSHIKKQSDFDLDKHFLELGESLKSLKKDFDTFHWKKLYTDQFNEDASRKLYSAVNSKLSQLGSGNNEPVGTSKVLHMMAPYYFPLIDNPIAKVVKLKEKRSYPDTDKLDINKYMIWMNFLKEFLKKYDPKSLDDFEQKMNLSILKLIDGGLYMMCTVTQSRRVNKLGFDIKSSSNKP